MKTTYQKGDHKEIRLSLDGETPTGITIIYQNEDDLPELEAKAQEMAETWQRNRGKE